MKIAIIGSGNMATAIGTRFAEGNQSLTIYDRSLDKATELSKKLGKGTMAKSLGETIEEEVVILALPYAAILELMEKHSDILSNKILVDISNPVDFQTFKLIPPVNSSGAEEIKRVAPASSSIVKAFNTVFSGVLLKGDSDGKKIDVFVASDNDEAKKTLSKIIEGSGMRPINAGPLSNAHALESFEVLHMTLQEQFGNTWMTSIKILP